MQKTALLLIALLVTFTQSCKDDKDGATPDKKEPVKVETITYKTFDQEHLAFGTGKNQTVEKTFTMHPSSLNVDSIKMFVILDCPSGGCNIWDVYANIKVKDPNGQVV